jgi:pyruvate carboxylase
VSHLIELLTKFIDKKSLNFESMNREDQDELLTLFRNAPGDFKNLILGHYGKLPMGWPPDWVYKSAFGEEREKKIKERKELSPLDSLEDDNLDNLRQELFNHIGRNPTEEEFILYLIQKMHWR